MIIDAYQFGGCTTPDEYWTDNSVTPGDCEVDGTSDTGVTPGDYTVSSTSANASDGTYAIDFVKQTAAGTDASGYFQFSNMTVSQSYTLTFDAYVVTPTNSNNNYLRASGLYAADWSVTQQVEINYGTDYTEYTMTVTPAVTNPRLQVYSSTVAVNVSGTTIRFDNFRWVEN